MKRITRLAIALISSMAIWAAAPRANASGYSYDATAGISIDATRMIQLPDTVDRRTHSELEREWKYLLVNRQLNPEDTTVIWPRFVKFCIRTAKWATRVFNSYDTTYVVPHKRKGKVKIVSQNWIDYYAFKHTSAASLIISGNVVPSIGLYAQYGPVSLGYSLDLSHLLSDETADSKRLDFSFTCARMHIQGAYRRTKGTTYIRRFGKFRPEDGKELREPFNGLKYRNVYLCGYYFFNNRKFSYGAAYNTANIQKKSSGTWIAGIDGSFTKAYFNFDRLPENLKDYQSYPLNDYSIYYHSVCLMGGYSYNWVINKYFLFNVTTLPEIGASFTFASSSSGKKVYLAGGGRQRLGLHYERNRWFSDLSADFTGSAYIAPGKVTFGQALTEFEFSIGMRF